jgi:hypothetical protein
VSGCETTDPALRVVIVKIRLQMQGSHNAGLQPQKKPAMSIVRELGLRGLYKGAPVTLMRDVPFSFIFFPIYSNLRDWWLRGKRHVQHRFISAAVLLSHKTVRSLTMAIMQDLRGDVGLVPTLLSGASAGAIAAAAVTPADVVKTRVQLENSPYTSISQCARYPPYSSPSPILQTQSHKASDAGTQLGRCGERRGCGDS